jgi:hypothetical protein
MGYGNNERDRLQDNLAKAFSLLDDDKPKSPYVPDYRIGTAPAGGQYGAAMNRSNYTGSDMGDSIEMDRRQSSGYGVPNLGLQQNSTFGPGLGMGGESEIATINIGGSRRSGQRFIGGNSSNRSGSDNRSGNPTM